MAHSVTRRCRLHLFTNYARLQSLPRRQPFSAVGHLATESGARDGTNDYKRRIAQLEEARGSVENCYPRLERAIQKHTPIASFRRKYEDQMQPSEVDQNVAVVVAGRVQSVRTAGNKLIFLDLKQDGHTVQIMCQYSKLEQDANIELVSFKSFVKLARKGDWYEAQGWPHRSSSGELSVLASAMPKLLAPALHQIPDTLDDAETRATNRALDMLVHPEAMQTLRVRHLVEQHLNRFFTGDGFIKVNTPILSASAGGAVARPFETKATEFEGQTLNLRIAPELWLKRLVVGGMEKVYEIGPAFRNEGVDLTHNPEFYTCEFYEALATLEDLMEKTERLLVSMAEAIEKVRDTQLSSLTSPTISLQPPYQRLQFIPTIEREMGTTLPDLADPNAPERIMELFKTHNIPTPTSPTLPRLLDALCSKYIEPLCQTPTFITHHPAVLSPLSKHTLCAQTNQTVSLRAELFIEGREYANMYEEENSPFAQRRKFLQQAAFREVDGEGDARGGLDENYIETLEWGLPPTGGWGCGIDRLVMLFAGRDRISDVLPFGTLRNVVAVSKGR